MRTQLDIFGAGVANGEASVPGSMPPRPALMALTPVEITGEAAQREDDFMRRQLMLPHLNPAAKAA